MKPKPEPMQASPPKPVIQRDALVIDYGKNDEIAQYHRRKIRQLAQAINRG